MRVIISYIVTNSFRSKLFLGQICAMILALFLAVFLGDTNLIEEKKAAVTFFAGTERVFLIIGMAIFVCLNIARLFDNKEVDFFLSKSISRESFVFALLSGYVVIASMLCLATILFLIIFLGVDTIRALSWALSLFLEILLVCAFALLCSLILESSLLAIFSTIGFYLLSRLMSLFTMSVDLPWQANVNSQPLAENILKILSIAFPRIDMFTQSIWLTGRTINPQEISIILIQTLVFMAIMTFMSFHDIAKKEF